MWHTRITVDKSFFVNCQSVLTSWENQICKPNLQGLLLLHTRSTTVFSLQPPRLICRLDIGHNIDTFKFFTMCGFHEGYKPSCFNMTSSPSPSPTPRSSPTSRTTKTWAAPTLTAGADNPSSHPREQGSFNHHLDTLPLNSGTSRRRRQTGSSCWSPAARGHHWAWQGWQVAGDPDAWAAKGCSTSSFLSCHPPPRNQPQPPSFDSKVLGLINEYFYGLDRTWLGMSPFYTFVTNNPSFPRWQPSITCTRTTSVRLRPVL